MIKSVSLLKEVHPFSAGTHIAFDTGLNVICGDQGSGKSTLLEMLMLHDREYSQHITVDQDNKFRAFAYYNSEYHNPRTIDGGLAIGETKYSATLDMFYDQLQKKLASTRLTNAQHFHTMLINVYANCKNMSNNVVDKKLVDLDVITSSTMMSHGQALFPFLEAALDVEGGIVFLDEPETSLSIKSQIKLAVMLSKAGENNQIFMATHSEILMKEPLKILSLDGLPEWVYADDYIRAQHETT